MHQRRAVGTEFALGAVEPQHRLALALGNRLPRPSAVDIFPAGIDRAKSRLDSRVFPDSARLPSTMASIEGLSSGRTTTFIGSVSSACA